MQNLVAFAYSVTHIHRADLGSRSKVQTFMKTSIFRTKQQSYSATQTAAMPMPVPTHMLVRPTFFFVRLSS